MLRLYGGLRSLLTPKRRTARYVLFETLLLATVMAIPAAYFEQYEVAGAAFGIAIITYLLRLAFVSRDRWKFEASLLEFERKTIIMLYTLLALYLGGVYAYVTPLADPIWRTPMESDPVWSFLYVPAIVFAFYWGYIKYIGNQYKEERWYYIHDFSPYKHYWVEASVAFELGHKNRKERNDYRAYYFFKEAHKLYQWLSEQEERHTYSEVARLHGEAAQEYSEVAYCDENEREYHSMIGEEFIQEAVEELSYRRCDKCKEAKPTEQIHQILDDNRYEDMLYCDSCYYEGVEHEDENLSDSEVEQEEPMDEETYAEQGRDDEWKDVDDEARENTRTSNTSSSSRSRSESNSRSQSSVTQSGEITVDEACSILGLERPFEEEEIANAFRKQIKKAHPDKGGTKEEFKRVKAARTRLNRYMRYQNE